MKGTKRTIVVKNVTTQAIGAWIPIQDHLLLHLPRKGDRSKGERSKRDRSKRDRSKRVRSKGDRSKGDRSKRDRSIWTCPSFFVRHLFTLNEKNKGERMKVGGIS